MPSYRSIEVKTLLPPQPQIAKIMPFPILGVDSDNGSEFINHHLLAWCERRKITFTRSRTSSGSKDLGALGLWTSWPYIHWRIDT